MLCKGPWKAGGLCSFAFFFIWCTCNFVFDRCRMETPRAWVSSRRQARRVPPSFSATIAHAYMEASCGVVFPCLSRRCYAIECSRVSWARKERRKHVWTLGSGAERGEQRSELDAWHPRFTICPERIRCAVAELALLLSCSVLMTYIGLSPLRHQVLSFLFEQERKFNFK